MNAMRSWLRPRPLVGHSHCIRGRMMIAPPPTESLPIALVIEDDPETRHLLVRALQPLGVRAIGFASAEAALAWVELNQTPDLITVDIKLPAMCGLRVCEWLRTIPRMRDVPIVVISARAEVQDLASALEVGAEFLAKPFKLQQLNDTVLRALRATSL